MNTIGLRKEEKPFETRVPMIPEHVSLLAKKNGISFIVEPSSQRAFDIHEFTAAGARAADLKNTNASVILGIKEMPIDFFQRDRVYVFFSHTVKGQKYNMPMLQKMIDVGATLIDYERVVDAGGKRLIFFGNWAGMAGMSDTLRSLGKRLDYEGLSPNPFLGLKETRSVRDLAELKNEFKKLGKRISDHGIPRQLNPFVVGFAGYGNVSRGAQDMFDILPHVSITPEELPNLKPNKNTLYKCIFKEEHMVEPIDPSAHFNLQDYYTHGKTKYRSTFHRHLPYLTILMNCIFWTSKFPRLLTNEFIKRHWRESSRKLRIIGDISCDIEGAIEFTVTATTPEQPAFTYLIDQDRIELGVKGSGPVVMAVDNLPCELPREASTSFSSTLVDYVPPLANADFTVPFEKLFLPRELKDAIIVYRGQLTEKYQYITDYLKQEMKT